MSDKIREAFEKEHIVPRKYSFVSIEDGYIHDENKTFPFLNNFFKWFVKGYTSASSRVAELEAENKFLCDKNGELTNQVVGLSDSLDDCCLENGRLKCCGNCYYGPYNCDTGKEKPDYVCKDWVVKK